MALKNRKVCLLIAGGTVLADSDDFCVEKESDVKLWIDRMPELMIMGAIDPVYICGEKSGDRGPLLWQKLAKEIFARKNDYIGFIVICSVAEILENALALTFALPNFLKPVVFTSSQLPVVNKELMDRKNQPYSGLGAKSNLINALQVAVMDFGAVGIMFGNRCLFPAKSQRMEVYSLNAFNSLDDTCLAKLDFGISLLENVPELTGKPELKGDFSNNVIAVKYYPGMDFNLFASAIAKAQGVMLEAMALEPFAQDFLAGLKTLKIPVLVYNRFFVPKLNAENIIEIDHLTKETALVKFIWSLGQTQDLAEIRSLMLNNLRGEFLNNLVITAAATIKK